MKKKILEDLLNQRSDLNQNEMNVIEEIIDIFLEINVSQDSNDIYLITNQLFSKLKFDELTRFKKPLLYMVCMCIIQKFYIDNPFNNKVFAHISKMDVSRFNFVELCVLDSFQYHLPISFIQIYICR